MLHGCELPFFHAGYALILTCGQTRYYGQWLKVLKIGVTFDGSGKDPTHGAYHAWCTSSIRARLGQGPGQLLGLDRVFISTDASLMACYKCGMSQWRCKLDDEIRKLKEFSTFL